MSIDLLKSMREELSCSEAVVARLSGVDGCLRVLLAEIEDTEAHLGALKLQATTKYQERQEIVALLATTRAEDPKVPPVEEAKVAAPVPTVKEAPQVVAIPKEEEEEEEEEEKSPRELTMERYEAHYGAHLPCFACSKPGRIRPLCDFYESIRRKEGKGHSLPAQPNCDYHTHLNDAMNDFSNPRAWVGISEERIAWLGKKEQKYRLARTTLLDTIKALEARGESAEAEIQAKQRLERRKARWMVELYKERIDDLLSERKSFKREERRLAWFQSLV